MQGLDTSGKPRNNKGLRTLISEVYARLVVTKNIDDLASLLDKIDSADIALSYDNRYPWGGLGIAVAGLIGFVSWAFLSNYNWNVWGAATVATGLVVAVGCYSVIKKRSQSLKRLTRAFVNKTLELLYKIKPLGGRECARLLYSFYDFQRGNYSRKISWAKSIEVEYGEETIRAVVAHLHYVNERTVTQITNRNGRLVTQRRKVYDHHHREGLILPNKLNFSPMIISQTGPSDTYTESYRPSSKLFRDHYQVRSDSQLDAAKFLEPVVVVAFEDLARKFDDVSYEISRSAGNLLCQKDALLTFEPKYTVQQPKKLKQELLNRTQLDSLNQLIGFNLKLISTHGD